MEFLRSIIVERASLPASTQLDLVDLPVNPVSHLLLTIEAVNTTTTAGNYSFIDDFYAYIDRVEVLFKGNSVINASLRDAWALSMCLLTVIPGQVKPRRTNSERRAATFILPFSRRLFDPAECFPASSRGEFQFRITTGATPPGLGSFTYTLDAVELLNAEPERFVRFTTFSGAASAVGEHDRDLPRGNPIVGVLLFANTVHATSEASNTIRDVKLLVDNKEMYYQLANWDALHSDFLSRLGLGVQQIPHTHAVDIADAGGTFRDSLEPDLMPFTVENYAYLDFDPARDGNFLLQTEGRGRVAMRITYGATDAMRYLPIELMKIQA